VTWVIWNGTNMMVKAARREPAAVASQWLTYTLSPSARDGLLPSVAMNQSGDAIVAWGLAGWPRTYTTCTLQVAKWGAGLGAPSAAVTLPAQQLGCVNYYSAPQVAIDGLGLGTVSWVFTNMYSLSETDAGVWQKTPVEVVRPGPGQYLSNPSLAGDAAGNLTIGYSIWDPNVGVDRGSAFAVSRPARGAWTTPYRFTYTTSQDAQFVRAATSADGSLTFVGWVDNYNSVLQVSQRSSAGGWLKPQTIGKSSNMGFAQYFSIGTANGGNARAVWKTQSGQSQVASQFRP
jgi:hypothetical protein